MYAIVYEFDGWHSEEMRRNGKLFQQRERESVNFTHAAFPQDSMLMYWEELLPRLVSIITYMRERPNYARTWHAFEYRIGKEPKKIPRREVMNELKKWLIKEKKLTIGEMCILGVTPLKN
jgi:hypothetical protein